jgi:hypothetical protein
MRASNEGLWRASTEETLLTRRQLLLLRWLQHCKLPLLLLLLSQTSWLHRAAQHAFGRCR